MKAWAALAHPLAPTPIGIDLAIAGHGPPMHQASRSVFGSLATLGVTPTEASIAK